MGFQKVTDYTNSKLGSAVLSNTYWKKYGLWVREDAVTIRFRGYASKDIADADIENHIVETDIVLDETKMQECYAKIWAVAFDFVINEPNTEGIDFKNDASNIFEDNQPVKVDINPDGYEY